MVFEPYSMISDLYYLQNLPIENHTLNQVAEQPITEELLEKIKENNSLDIRLYEYAYDKFHR